MTTFVPRHRHGVHVPCGVQFRAAPASSNCVRLFRHQPSKPILAGCCQAASDDSSLTNGRGKGRSYSLTEEMNEFCAPAFVAWSNDDAHFTKMRIQIMDYPGLLRVIAWVLNGMEVVVDSAKLSTTEDGMVEDVFYLTTPNGKQLPDGRAQSVKEQLEDFLMYCSKPLGRSTVEWQNGCIYVSNASHSRYTEVTVLESGTRRGFLLEIASVMSGVGIEVREADIRSCKECHVDTAVPHLLSACSGSVEVGRVFKLFVCEQSGGKLSETSVNTVLYTLGLLMGQGTSPTVVPTLVSYAVRDCAAQQPAVGG